MIQNKKMCRLCTNARGGSTREGLTKESSLVNHIISLMDFLKKILQAPRHETHDANSMLKALRRCLPAQPKHDTVANHTLVNLKQA